MSETLAETWAGAYFDFEIAPTYGRIPDDISKEHLAAKRRSYVADAIRSPAAMASIMAWVSVMEPPC